MRWMLLTLSVLTLTATAGAQTNPVDARFEEGRALRRDHRDAEALAHFQRMYADLHLPRALAQVGLAEFALGRWTDAEEHIALALAQPDAWVNENRVAGVGLDRQMQIIAAHLGSLDVACDVRGAELWIGGRRVGTLPLARPARVAAGSVTFEVRASGRAAAVRTINVSPGATAQETVALAPGSHDAVTLPPRTEGSSGTLRTLAWVAAGGAVVFVGGGVVAYSIGASVADHWNDDQQCLRPGRTREEVCPGEGSTIATMSGLEIAGFIGGAALAATSVALFVVSGGRSRDATTAFSCGAGPGELGLSCGTRF